MTSSRDFARVFRSGKRGSSPLITCVAGSGDAGAPDACGIRGRCRCRQRGESQPREAPSPGGSASNVYQARIRGRPRRETTASEELLPRSARGARLRARAGRRVVLGRAAALLVRLYQFTLGKYLPSRCRFVPSCSEFAVEALRTNGLLVGGFQTLWRLLRCAPWSAGGFDPVVDHRRHHRRVSAHG